MAKTLKCSNCTFETREDELRVPGSWHACWLDRDAGHCEITGFHQEGSLKLKNWKRDDESIKDKQ